MVPEKRKLMVVSGAIAAAFALPGCAPAGYNAADYGTGAQPAANAVEATPTPGAELEPEAGAEGEEKTDDGTEKQKDTPELTDEELTNKLRATKVKRMGTAVVDEGGWVLYRFDKDKSNPSKSNCEGTCAKIWPPALTDGDPELEMVYKYLSSIQVRRQDFNGRVLTIRADDIRAIAGLFGTDADALLRRLDDLQLRLQPA